MGRLDSVGQDHHWSRWIFRQGLIRGDTTSYEFLLTVLLFSRHLVLNGDWFQLLEMQKSEGGLSFERNLHDEQRLYRLSSIGYKVLFTVSNYMNQTRSYFRYQANSADSGHSLPTKCGSTRGQIFPSSVRHIWVGQNLNGINVQSSIRFRQILDIYSRHSLEAFDIPLFDDTSWKINCSISGVMTVLN